MTDQKQKSFQQWMQQVDRALNAKCGLSHNDLADQCWRDWYEDEMSAEEAAYLCLEDEGFPEE